jgi:aspartyl-tRNA(Asn)/glutamyl-tRNA(Gln) amidotransferase subunit A
MSVPGEPTVDWLLEDITAALESYRVLSTEEPATRFDPHITHPKGPDGLTGKADGGLLTSVNARNIAHHARRRQLVPMKDVSETISMAEEASNRYGAFVTLCIETAVQEAEKSARHLAVGRPRSPLEGVPIAVKDVLDIRGYPTTGGSPINSTGVAQADARCVAHLREAGSVVIGKTALHEWAYGVTSDNAFFGTVRNPIDPERIPGGSSGGSAVAVACGAVCAAIGSDTGGSIRIPAAACGIIGFKPTYDRISRHGCIPQAWSLDHLGSFARNVGDAWIVAEVAARGEQADLMLIDATLNRLSNARRLDGRRFGLWADWEEFASETVARVFNQGLDLIRLAGAEVEPFNYPNAEAARAAWLAILIAESAAYHSVNLRTRPQQISPEIRFFIEAGSKLGAENYLHAQRMRSAWIRDVDAAMADFDAVLAPTLPDVAPTIGTEALLLPVGEVPLRDAYVHYQWPANLSGAPALSMPILQPTSQSPLPVGLMLTGRAGMDTAFIELALLVENCLRSDA